MDLRPLSGWTLILEHHQSYQFLSISKAMRLVFDLSGDDEWLRGRLNSDRGSLQVPGSQSPFVWDQGFVRPHSEWFRHFTTASVFFWKCKTLLSTRGLSYFTLWYLYAQTLIQLLQVHTKKRDTFFDFTITQSHCQVVNASLNLAIYCCVCPSTRSHLG